VLVERADGSVEDVDQVLRRLFVVFVEDFVVVLVGSCAVEYGMVGCRGHRCRRSQGSKDLRSVEL
jgi:hypothetical protein